MFGVLTWVTLGMAPKTLPKVRGDCPDGPLSGGSAAGLETEASPADWTGSEGSPEEEREVRGSKGRALVNRDLLRNLNILKSR